MTPWEAGWNALAERSHSRRVDQNHPCHSLCERYDGCHHRRDAYHDSRGSGTHLRGKFDERRSHAIEYPLNAGTLKEK